MKSKVYSSFDEAAADIPDGATIMIGGFGPGTPRNLIAALRRQGARRLTVICNSPGDGSGRIYANHLIQDGQVAKVICSFISTADPSTALLDLASGHTEAELVPQGTLAERIRAGGAGIPAFYTPVGAGTDLAQGKESREFNARPHILERALTADYALVRVWKADLFGNLVFRLAQRNFNPLMAMAARCTIAEVEQPMVEVGSLDPDTIHTSGIFVDRMVQIPPPPDGLWDEPWSHWE